MNIESMQVHSNHAQGAFRALSDPTRRDILLQLSVCDLTIKDVADQYDITRAAVKKHLNILEEGGLISVRSEGRERINRLEPDGMKHAHDWLEYFNRFWDERLASLKQVIENDERRAKTMRRKSK